MQADKKTANVSVMAQFLTPEEINDELNMLALWR
jgi:hypothetical protein